MTLRDLFFDLVMILGLVLIGWGLYHLAHPLLAVFIGALLVKASR